MTRATSRRQRLPLLAALAVSVLAHAITLLGGWLPPPQTKADPPPLLARLEAMTPVATPPPPTPKPAAAPPRKPMLAAAPRPVIADTRSAFALPAPAESTDAAPEEAPALAFDRSEPPEPMVIADAAPSTFLPERAAIKSLPRRGRIAYALYLGSNKFEVARTVQSWETSADTYKLESTSGTSGLVSLFRDEQRIYRSSGRMTEHGLRPEHFESSRIRRGQADDAVARFDWDNHSITLSRGNAQRSAALPAGSQDLLSFMYQLALAPPPPGRVQFAITNGASFENYALDVLAEETLETPMGNLRVLPVKQVRREGGESIEVWLAADYRYLPVRLRFPPLSLRFIGHAQIISVSSHAENIIYHSRNTRFTSSIYPHDFLKTQLKFTPAQFEAAVHVLTAVLKFDYPADGIVSRYFREHSELGQNDRAFIAEAVFGVLRRKRMLDHLTGGASVSPARALLLAWLARTQGLNSRELAPVLRRGDDDTVTAIKSASTDNLPLAVQAELPDWVVEKLLPHTTEAEILELGRGLASPAPLDLRVNTLRAKRDAVIATLAASGITATPTPYSPCGLRIDGRPAINRLPMFLDGTIEVQDEGSQVLCCLLAPTRHDFVIDFCAGAGGKTLMLGAMMHNRGRLYAFDTSAARLKKLQPRLARSGLSNLRAQVISRETDLRVKRLAGKADRVLVDAPCSGLGTLRRNPDLKWRQSPQSVAELVVKQTAILRAAAALLKPGARLVYATCSLLAEENEAIVDTFLATHAGFSLVDCDSVLAQQKIALRTGKYLRLAPHAHGTDGFFGAVLTRMP